MNTFSIKKHLSKGDNIISFSDAQKLFNLYSPLKTNDDLYKSLSYVLDMNYWGSDLKTNPRELYNELILKYYPNETSVKSSFINNVLLKSNNHISIFELKVGESRADLCKINGRSIAYEIKTDLDNLQRLDKQLLDYMHIFEKVYVICSINKSEHIKNCLPLECGLYEYKITKNGQYRFKMIKEASPSPFILPLNQLTVLTKRELVSQFKIDSSIPREEMIEEVILNNSASKINLIFKKCMKQKYDKQWTFLKNNHTKIYDIDYQWFFKNTISPSLIYQ